MQAIRKKFTISDKQQPSCVANALYILIAAAYSSTMFAVIVVSAWQADTFAVFVKAISTFEFCCSCAALAKWPHSQHDMTTEIAFVGIVNGIINAHTSGTKLRETVFPDKPDLFLSG